MDWIQELTQKESLCCSLTAFLDQHGFSGLETALQLYSNTQAEYICKTKAAVTRIKMDDIFKVGQVMEILRQRGVRLIAINDGVDSANGENDFTPFLNIMYEFYARDTSRKIKSVFKAKGMSGKHLTGTVIYGYLWDEKREHPHRHYRPGNL